MNEYLTIGTVAFNVVGCALIPDLSPLLSDSDQLGDDVLLGSGGVSAYSRIETITVVNLEVLIFGEKDFTGAAHPDVRTGLYRNLKHIHTNVTAPVPTGDGTRTATLTWQSETPVVKPVHVLGNMSTADDRTTLIRGVLRLSFPEGLFTL